MKKKEREKGRLREGERLVGEVEREGEEGKGKVGEGEIERKAGRSRER